MRHKNRKTTGEAEINAVIDRCLDGDNRAFENIVRRFQGPVYHTCLHFAHTPQDAEDAAADVFIKAFRSLTTFDPQYKFSTWLFKIAVNHCIQVARKKKRETDYLHRHFSENRDQADHETPAVLLFRSAEKSRVKEALLSIPLKYQAALMLKYYQELSYQEIGEILAVPKNTVASLILRGKKALREKLTTIKESEVSHET